MIKKWKINQNANGNYPFLWMIMISFLFLSNQGGRSLSDKFGCFLMNLAFYLFISKNFESTWCKIFCYCWYDFQKVGEILLTHSHNRFSGDGCGVGLQSRSLLKAVETHESSFTTQTIDLFFDLEALTQYQPIHENATLELGAELP